MVLALALVACVRTNAAECPNGAMCPENTVCVEVANPQHDPMLEQLCVDPGAVTACAGMLDGSDCSDDPMTKRTCYGGVCLPGGCGNDRIDLDEVCDDGNQMIGDGCSGGCQSNETCGNGVVDPLPLVAGLPNEVCDDGDFVANDGCESSCRPELPQWHRIDRELYPARNEHAVVYDAARRRFVMFGGRGQLGLLGDTWESDGRGIERVVTDAAPAARVGHAMAYDAARRRTVLFGGNLLADTWTWDGATWKRQVVAVSPPGRNTAAIAYDSRRKKVVLFGGMGSTNTLLGDTWEWDGEKWSERVFTLKPQPRERAVMAYDAVRGVIVLAGGEAGARLQNTWELDDTGWHEVADAQTPQLRSPGVAFDSVSGRILTYGSLDQVTAPVTYSFDGSIWRNVNLQAGSANRFYPAMASSPDSGKILLVGGLSDSALNTDRWEWNGSTWSQVTSEVPPAVGFRGAATDPVRGQLVGFGGLNSGAAATRDMSLYSGTTWTNAAVPAISARTAPALAYDARRAQVVMFGGRNTAVPLGQFPDDTWVWNGAAWSTSSPAVRPPPRWLHAMAYDVVRERIVMFGGDMMGARDDTWEWDGQSWQEIVPPVRPPARAGHAMFYDPIRGTVVMSGGWSGPFQVYGDTWEWNGITWTPAPQLTAEIEGHAVTWHGNRGGAVMFGGSTLTIESVLADTVEWTGTWVETITTTRPEPRTGHSIVPNPGTPGVVSIGGAERSVREGGNVRAIPTANEMWRFRYANTHAVEQCLVDVDNDGDGLLGCLDPDCWGNCTPLCPPGATCAANLPRCGDGTCASAIENCRNCDADCDCPVVCGDFFCDPTETATSCPGDC